MVIGCKTSKTKIEQTQKNNILTLILKKMVFYGKKT